VVFLNFYPVFKIVRKVNEYIGEEEKLETVLLKFTGGLKNLILPIIGREEHFQYN
jgi:hypothetical protein